MKVSSLTMAMPRHKSTTVRLVRDELTTAPLRTLAWLAPGLVGRIAIDRFLRPPNLTSHRPRPSPLLDRAADRFTVTLRTRLGEIEEECRVQVALWGRGPAVYLVHGWGGRGLQWAPFIDPLVEAGFCPVVFDAPGHGETPAPRTSILHFAAAVRCVVESVGPAQCIVGHSAGAAAAALSVRRGVPAARLVLIGCPADPGDLFRPFLSKLGIHEKAHPAIRREVERRYGFHWDELLVRRPDSAPSTLLIHDRDDKEVPFAEANRIKLGWPDAELMSTNGLGHRRILRDQAVIEKVVRFAAAA